MPAPERAKILLFMLLALCFALNTCVKSFAAGREVDVPDVQFQPIQPTHALTIKDAVEIALRNYPEISAKVFKLKAAKANVKLAKTQYLPNLNLDIQESYITPNRISSAVMNNVSGFDTVPVNSGPNNTHSTGRGNVNNLDGLNFNWLLVDQGLRHANDDYAYADTRTARADVTLTKLDVAFDTSEAFLEAVLRKQVIISTTAAVEHMEAANLRARTLVSQGLRPGVDTADWDYEVAKSRIALIRAEKDRRLSLVDLAEKAGIASSDIEIVSDPLIRRPTNISGFASGDLTSHPLALVKSAEIDRWRAKQKVLDKAYRPHLWLNASVWGLGGNDKSNVIKPVLDGFAPQIYDYMVGLTYSFPFMEYFPLKAQKEMARNNELAARSDFDLAMQVLEKKDARARIELEQARKIAEQTPILVDAAKVREIKVIKRYGTGLTNMVSLAEAEKALASAQVEDAQAQVEVWRSILHLAYIQGDLKPFLQIVTIAEGDMTSQSAGR